MPDALTVIGCFGLGFLVGSGVVGGFIGWLWASDDRVASFVAGLLHANRGLRNKVDERLLTMKRSVP